MQSRFTLEDKRGPITAKKYTVFEGFVNFFDGFAPWLVTLVPAPPIPNARSSVCARGRRAFWVQRHKSWLFERSASLRDTNPNVVLTNSIWNARG